MRLSYHDQHYRQCECEQERQEYLQSFFRHLSLLSSFLLEERSTSAIEPPSLRLLHVVDELDHDSGIAILVILVPDKYAKVALVELDDDTGQTDALDVVELDGNVVRASVY